ncbi:sporulation protein YabP [Merdibacter massiliensis]|uniref:sporulation protein YabP n=1 Tax=Merdibacter massiliensis TaxID=1871030 RepID=UPI00096A6881|nr:sporulation protein YabP [Merdibacter massiliensis]
MEESVNPLRFETNPYHHVVIKDRKTMELSGVKQIDSFDSDEFLLETTLGWMLINGKDLSLGKLDTEHGDLIIKGNIDSINYLSNKKGQERTSLFARLFK